MKKGLRPHDAYAASARMTAWACAAPLRPFHGPPHRRRGPARRRARGAPAAAAARPAPTAAAAAPAARTGSARRSARRRCWAQPRTARARPPRAAARRPRPSRRTRRRPRCRSWAGSAGSPRPSTSAPAHAAVASRLQACRRLSGPPACVHRPESSRRCARDATGLRRRRRRTPAGAGAALRARLARTCQAPSPRHCRRAGACMLRQGCATHPRRRRRGLHHQRGPQRLLRRRPAVAALRRPLLHRLLRRARRRPPLVPVAPARSHVCATHPLRSAEPGS